MKKFVLFFLIFLFSPFILGMEVSFSKNQYIQGETVWATVSARGDIGVESDLTLTSFGAKTDKNGRIPLGKVSAPGIYMIRLIHKTDSCLLTLLFLPEQGTNQYWLVWNKPSPKKIDYSKWKSEEKNIFTRFINGINSDRIKRALENSKQWLKDDAVSLGSTVAICLTAAGIPVVMPVCGERAKGHAIDFGKNFILSLIDILKADNILKPNEAEFIKSAILVVDFITDIKNVLKGEDKIEEALDALEKALSKGAELVQNPHHKMFLNRANLFVTKCRVLIKIGK
ncbi:MAG: hypothetical protein HUU50_07780 [Candidatus Brocadiae bacterium]|nr:hypothetical protein [Candidatus Brocadiia bacterium]